MTDPNLEFKAYREYVSHLVSLGETEIKNFSEWKVEWKESNEYFHDVMRNLSFTSLMDDDSDNLLNKLWED